MRKYELLARLILRALVPLLGGGAMATAFLLDEETVALASLVVYGLVQAGLERWTADARKNGRPT